MRPLFPLLACLFLWSAGARAAEEKREYRWEFPARDVVSLMATVKIGAIRVITDRKDRVEVRATRTVRARRRELARALAEDAPIDVALQDRRVTLDDRWPTLAGDEKEPPEIRLEVEIHAPPGIGLRTGLDQGETRVEGEVSLLTVRGGSGAVRLTKQKIRRSALVALDAGSVEIEGQVADLTISIGTGTLKAEKLEAGGAESVVLQSQAGEMRASFKSLPRRELRLQTGTGHATLRIPGSARATATVITASGKASSDFPLPRAARSDGDTGGYLAGSIGGGGVSVKVQTGAGNATLERG